MDLGHHDPRMWSFGEVLSGKSLMAVNLQWMPVLGCEEAFLHMQQAHSALWIANFYASLAMADKQQ